ncbi:hypothetical protein BD779DRAFT_1441401 [Infundibulicybe gibba]|nr:hypothetical protein BD779DRAFT_1441401 [Infundibulicybe gibba]
MIDLSLLSLFQATHAQMILSRRRTFTEWGKGMSEEEYLQRDLDCDAFEHTKDGKLITWVLAPRNQPDSIDFLCSCETFRRPGLAQFPGEGIEATEPKRVSCYGIASVFTPIQNRGKGYAKHMTRLLHWVLAPSSALAVEDFPEEWGAPPPRAEQAGDAMFSALWSDVGRELYWTCGPMGNTDGWTVSDAISTSFDLNKADLETNKPEGGPWLWLDEAALLRAWDQDAERIGVEMKSEMLAGDRKVSFSILPTEGVAAFHHRRNMFLVKRALPDAIHWGIIKPSNVEGTTFTEKTVFASWMIEVRPPGPRTLLVTRLRANTEAFEGLIKTLKIFARNNGVEKIEVWNLPHDLRNSAETLGGHSYERDEHLPAFKWYGPEAASDLVWIFSERSVLVSDGPSVQCR